VVQRLVVVGGDAAGMSAATAARRRLSREALEIVAVERGQHTSYSACGIPYWIGGEVGGPEQLVARTPQEFRDKHDIDVRLRSEVVALEPARCAVTVRGPDGEYSLAYDHLMLGLGAVPSVPDLPGVDASGVYGVQTLGDGEAVRAALASSPARAVVVGGGYIGLELAEALVRRGLAVTLVEGAAELMSTVDPDMGAQVRAAMAGMGIDVHVGEPMRGIETDSAGHARAVVTDAGSYDADIVVLGLGVRPNTALAADAGISLGARNAVSVDRRMRTRSHENIWAGGDCAESFHRVLNAPVHIPLGTHANRHGRIAGTNLAGGYAHFAGVIGTALTRICEFEIARTGLSSAEADRAGFSYLAVTTDSTTRAGYLPDAGKITVKLLAERDTARLIGAQIVGHEGAAKRIDVLATAIWTGLTVTELADIDLSYAPPFGPVWDPVSIAARRTTERLG
jgi:NADPH-dependent 2,4-dienoyl-CoA reductase/sulfur reductase-like enzyme